jgi:hypothetical protein
MRSVNSMKNAFAKASGLIGRELSVGLAPAVVGLLGDSERLQHDGPGLALSDERLAAWSLRTGLLGCAASALQEVLAATPNDDR